VDLPQLDVDAGRVRHSINYSVGGTKQSLGVDSNPQDPTPLSHRDDSAAASNQGGRGDWC
jgi:hypothetical protein